MKNSSTDSDLREPNELIHSTSPYLLQHAHNPVKWFPWGDAALQKAKSENKLLLISIGYSACHWCHVMERESFENEEVATVMNKFFVCIKVDREERPDVDQIYMDAVQLMTGRGGWPLNCITLPDKRPIFGGTYFPKEQWQSALLQIATLYINDPEKCSQYAEELTQGVRRMEKLKSTSLSETLLEGVDVEDMYNRWSKQFDLTDGGPNRAPKFPLPDNYLYLLRYWYLSKNDACKNYLQLTLKKMAYGGIYDQLGGGFARYSTDSQWKVPHFEKMLYDNAQLIILYSQAWQAFKIPLYKNVVEETLDFIDREMTSKNGGFYAALDADSEGVEGLFYCWKESELKEILKNDFDLFADYYNVNKLGYWEDDLYILLRNEDDELIAKRNLMDVETLRTFINVSKQKLMTVRSKRIRPGLDNKILCSWNAMMMKAYSTAYMIFGKPQWIASAEQNAAFIFENLMTGDGALLHTCIDATEINKSDIKGFLDDYAFVIDAMISLYEATFNEKYLTKAKNYCEYVITHFSDDTTGLFYFTSNTSEKLIARKTEVQDNVISSSNAMMAQILFLLGTHFDENNYLQRSEKMVLLMKKEIVQSTPWYSRWAQVWMQLALPGGEAVFTGENASQLRNEWMQNYLPDMLIAGAEKNSSLPLLSGRVSESESQIYICREKSCFSPVKNVNDALSYL